MSRLVEKVHHHGLNSIFDRLKDGIPSFISANSIQLIRANQEHCLERVNALVKGTRLETHPISRIIQITSNDLSMTHLYNYASQAWNNDFFLFNLARYKVDIPPITASKLQTDFGSLEGWQKEFSNHAEFLFGNGWTWLIRNEEGKLQIINTTNGASPIYHSGIVKKDPLSIPSLLGQKIYARVPLLCLNLWQHAYLLDFGMHKLDYVSTFFQFIDWQKVDSSLAIENESIKIFE